MKKTNQSKKSTFLNNIDRNPTFILIMAFIAILLGIAVLFLQTLNKPIPREEAEAYSGEFDYYDITPENDCEVYFEDGSCYFVYSCFQNNFNSKINALEKGTKLYILVNPNNNYVVEIKTDTEEILNFELSQQEISSDAGLDVFFGVFLCGCGVFLIFYSVILKKNNREEDQAYSVIEEKINSGINSSAIRYADMSTKSRTFLEAKVEGYDICYRRIKSTNELVINGRVYDEKKGVFEFAHRLFAAIDGHCIEAGYDGTFYTYISFDGKIIKQKKRFI